MLPEVLEEDSVVMRTMQSYLEGSGEESDNFIQGLDITFKQATSLFNDLLLTMNDGQDLEKKVLDPTDGHNQE